MEIHLLSSPPEQASSLFLAWVHSTGSCDLNWAKVKDFLFAYPIFMRICSLVLPYLTHKLFPPQDTSLPEDWAGSESHYSDFTVTEVAKFTKKRGSENTSYILRHKGVQALWWSATGQEDHLCSWSHLWPGWEEGCANECKMYISLVKTNYIMKFPRWKKFYLRKFSSH